MIKEYEAREQVQELCRKHGISGAKYYSWRKRFRHADQQLSAFRWLEIQTRIEPPQF